VDGVNWHDSGTVVVLPTGTYTIRFSNVSGWALPAIGNVTIEGTNAVTISNDQTQVGDLNNDNEVDLIDAILSLKISSGSGESPTGYWYDVNGDLKLGIPEAIDILREVSQ
jgi:hypothetical protein